MAVHSGPSDSCAAIHWQPLAMQSTTDVYSSVQCACLAPANRAAAPVIPNEIVGNGTAFAPIRWYAARRVCRAVPQGRAICLNIISVCSAAVRLCGRRLMGRPLWSASSSLFSKEMEDWGFASIVLSWMELGSYCLYRTHSLCLEFYFLIRWILLINLNRCLNTKFLNASS